VHVLFAAFASVISARCRNSERALVRRQDADEPKQKEYARKLRAENLMKTVQLTIITPEKLVYKGEAESIVVPAYSGMMGILPSHASLAARLKTGTVTIVNSGDVSRFTISDGFLHIEPTTVEIMVDTADKA
jgi:hypothetical protein